MKYRCDDCKDTGYVTLLLTRVECDCRKRVSKPTEKKPYWVNLYREGLQTGARG